MHRRGPCERGGRERAAAGLRLGPHPDPAGRERVIRPGSVSKRHGNALGERMSDEKILILDFGSQVTQLIARRVRESGVYCEILPFNISAGRLAEFAPAAIILSGGP